MTDPHLNRAERLPPVDCPLLIDVGGTLVLAERTCHVSDRNNNMTYRLSDGSTLIGRFNWTYP